MKRIKEPIIFALIIILFTSTLATAAGSWDQLFIRATKDIATSQGTVRLASKSLLDRVTAKTIAKAALTGGAAIAESPIVGLVGLGIGLYYLKSDWTDLINFLKTVSSVFTPAQTKDTTSVDFNLSNGKKLTIMIWSTQNPPYQGYVPYATLNVTVTSNGVTAYSSTGQGEVGVQVVTLYILYDNVPVQSIGYFPVTGWTNNITYSGVSLTSRSPVLTPAAVSDSGLSTWVDNNPEYFYDPDYVTNSIESSSTSPHQDLPEASSTITQGPAGEPGSTYDPETGEPTEPVTDPNADPNDEDDPLNIPNQAGAPAVDTSIESPEQKDIGGLIEGWLENAPFMNIISNFEVEATSGDCEVEVPVPFGGTATLDFCAYSTLWATIAAIIISFAYIYAVMIVFGGKA